MILALIFLSACGPALHTQVLNLQPGDSETRVREALGDPKSFSSQKEGDVSLLTWIYEKQTDRCVIHLKDHEVSGTSCRSEGEPKKNLALKALGAFGKGFSDSINASQSAPSPIVCNTQISGMPGLQTANTLCH